MTALDRMFDKLIQRVIDIVGSIVGLLLSAPGGLRCAGLFFNRPERSYTVSDDSAGMIELRNVEGSRYAVGCGKTKT